MLPHEQEAQAVSLAHEIYRDENAPLAVRIIAGIDLARSNPDKFMPQINSMIKNLKLPMSWYDGKPTFYFYPDNPVRVYGYFDSNNQDAFKIAGEGTPEYNNWKEYLTGLAKEMKIEADQVYDVTWQTDPIQRVLGHGRAILAPLNTSRKLQESPMSPALVQAYTAKYAEDQGYSMDHPSVRRQKMRYEDTTIPQPIRPNDEENNRFKEMLNQLEYQFDQEAKQLITDMIDSGQKIYIKLGTKSSRPEDIIEIKASDVDVRLSFEMDMRDEYDGKGKRIYYIDDKGRKRLTSIFNNYNAASEAEMRIPGQHNRFDLDFSGHNPDVDFTPKLTEFRLRAKALDRLEEIYEFAYSAGSLDKIQILMASGDTRIRKLLRSVSPDSSPNAYVRSALDYKDRLDLTSLLPFADSFAVRYGLGDKIDWSTALNVREKGKAKPSWIDRFKEAKNRWNEFFSHREGDGFGEPESFPTELELLVGAINPRVIVRAASASGLFHMMHVSGLERITGQQFPESPDDLLEATEEVLNNQGKVDIKIDSREPLSAEYVSFAESLDSPEMIRLYTPPGTEVRDISIQNTGGESLKLGTDYRLLKDPKTGKYIIGVMPDSSYAFDSGVIVDLGLGVTGSEIKGKERKVYVEPDRVAEVAQIFDTDLLGLPGIAAELRKIVNSGKEIELSEVMQTVYKHSRYGLKGSIGQGVTLPSQFTDFLNLTREQFVLANRLEQAIPMKDSRDRIIGICSNYAAIHSRLASYLTGEEYYQSSLLAGVVTNGITSPLGLTMFGMGHADTRTLEGNDVMSYDYTPSINAERQGNLLSEIRILFAALIDERRDILRKLRDKTQEKAENADLTDEEIVGLVPETEVREAVNALYSTPVKISPDPILWKTIKEKVSLTQEYLREKVDIVTIPHEQREEYLSRGIQEQQGFIDPRAFIYMMRPVPVVLRGSEEYNFVYSEPYAQLFAQTYFKLQELFTKAPSEITEIDVDDLITARGILNWFINDTPDGWLAIMSGDPINKYRFGERPDNFPGLLTVARQLLDTIESHI